MINHGLTGYFPVNGTWLAMANKTKVRVFVEFDAVITGSKQLAIMQVDGWVKLQKPGFVTSDINQIHIDGGQVIGITEVEKPEATITETITKITDAVDELKTKFNVG